MLRPAPLPPCPRSQQTTQLLAVPLDLPRQNLPLVTMVTVAFVGAVVVSFSLALGSLTVATAVREAAQPTVIVSAPPLPAPMAPATPRR